MMRRDEESLSWDALLLCILLFGVLVGFFGSGCSSGPQLPIVTVPIHVTCSWSQAPDGGAFSDNDCLVDRISPVASPTTTGVESRDNTVNPRLDVGVSP